VRRLAVIAIVLVIGTAPARAQGTVSRVVHAGIQGRTDDHCPVVGDLLRKDERREPTGVAGRRIVYPVVSDGWSVNGATAHSATPNP
jgi:hypothetical protein